MDGERGANDSKDALQDSVLVFDVLSSFDWFSLACFLVPPHSLVGWFRSCLVFAWFVTKWRGPGRAKIWKGKDEHFTHTPPLPQKQHFSRLP